MMLAGSGSQCPWPWQVQGASKVGHCQERNVKNTEDTEGAENHREIAKILKRWKTQIPTLWPSVLSVSSVLFIFDKAR
jgi:hypothetical protein